MSPLLLPLLVLFSVLSQTTARPPLYRRAAILHADESSCGGNVARVQQAFDSFPELATLAHTLVSNYREYHNGQHEELDPFYVEGVQGGLRELLGISDFSTANKDVETALSHLNYVYEHMAHFKDSDDPATNVPLFCKLTSWLKEKHNGQRYADQDGKLEDDEVGGWDSIHNKWRKFARPRPPNGWGMAASTAQFPHENPPNVVTIDVETFDLSENHAGILEPIEIIQNPIPGRLYDLFKLLKSYTGLTFHEYTHTEWSGHMHDMLYDPRKKDVKNQALRNHDALTVEDGGRPALAWKELKILALQNMTWALYNADTLTALAIGFLFISWGWRVNWDSGHTLGQQC